MTHSSTANIRGFMCLKFMAKKNKINQDVFDVSLSQMSSFATKGGAKSVIKENIPTGHFNLDFAIHFGELPGRKSLDSFAGYDSSKNYGIPLGKVVEIYGEEGSGKSSLCYRLVGNAQKLKYPCLWVDLEQSFAENLAVVNGVDMEELFYCGEPLYAEKIMDNILQSIEAGIKFIVIDSVPSLVPKEQMEKKTEDIQMALRARVLSKSVPEIVSKCGEYGATVIFINQVRQKPGSMFGDAETTPGGNALKFYSSIRLKLTHRTSANNAIFIEDPDDPGRKKYIGQYSGLLIKKNRFGKPVVNEDGKREMINIPIYFESYFPDMADIAFDTGRQLKIISVRLGLFSWGDLKGKSRVEIIEALSDPNILDKLIEEIRQEASQSGTILPNEIICYDRANLAEKVPVTDADYESIIKKKE